MNIRSQIQNRQRFISGPKSLGPGTFFGVCLLSLVCHALFFISLFFLNDFQFSAPKPKVVTVDLVTFAPGPANIQTSGQSPMPDEPASDNADDVNPDALSQTQSQPAEPRTPEIPIIKPEVSLKSKPHNLKDLIAAREKEPPKKEPPKKEPPKKEPPKEKRVEKKKKPKEKTKKKLEQDLAMAKAKKEQAQKLEKQRQAQLKNALARMKDSVASKENDAKGTNFDGNGGMATNRAGAGSGGGGGGIGEATPLTLYQMVIKSAIEQNWVFNDVMAGLDQDLEVRIFIKILKSGDIRDISFETRSGNNY